MAQASFSTGSRSHLLPDQVRDDELGSLLTSYRPASRYPIPGWNWMMVPGSSQGWRIGRWKMAYWTNRD